MFEHWMRFAPTMSGRLGLDTATITRAHDVVCSTMGWSWLQEHDKPIGGARRSISDTHPLYLALTGRTEGSVLEVLHLAAYFFAFRDDPGLGESIASLRNAGKYAPAIIELDLAWKFRNAGAIVRLFPATPKGKGDFAAIIDGVERVVETSGFPSDPLRDDGMSLVNAMSASFVSAVRKAALAVPLSLELEVEELSGAIRPSVHTAVKQLVHAFRQSNGDARIEQTHDFGTVAVRPTVLGEGPRGDSKWTKAARIGSAALAKTRIFGDSDYSLRGAGSWIYLCDRSADPDPFVRIQRKLRNEARQLSGCADGMIILDIEALGLDVINDGTQLRLVTEEFSRSHRSTTGVAIVVKPEKMNGQRGVSGHYFPLAGTALPTDFWDRMVSLDAEANLLSELSRL